MTPIRRFTSAGRIPCTARSIDAGVCAARTPGTAASSHQRDRVRDTTIESSVGNGDGRWGPEANAPGRVRPRPGASASRDDSGFAATQLGLTLPLVLGASGIAPRLGARLAARGVGTVRAAVVAATIGLRPGLGWRRLLRLPP